MGFSLLEFILFHFKIILIHLVDIFSVFKYFIMCSFASIMSYHVLYHVFITLHYSFSHFG